MNPNIEQPFWFDLAGAFALAVLVVIVLHLPSLA